MSRVKGRSGIVVVLLTAMLSGLITALPGDVLGARHFQEGDSELEALQPDGGDGTPGADGNEDADGTAVYESPNFRFVVTYDADVWGISSESSGNGEDYVTFYNGPSFVTLNATAGYAGDVVGCRNDWARSLRRIDGVTDFRPMVDDDGNELTGQNQRSAYGVYTYTSEDGDEVFNLECRELVPGAANLVIIHETYADVYDEELEAASFFLEGLDTSNVVESVSDGVAIAPGSSGERDPVDPSEAGFDLILLVDTFERPERSLLSTTTPDPNLVRYAYEDGKFVIETLADDAGAWQAGLPNVYREVAIAVDTTFASEPGGRYVKVACRSNMTAGGLNEYSLLIDPLDGYVALDSWVDGQRTPLYEEIRGDVVHLATETNRIELACFGNRIEAIINRTVVASVEDDTHTVGSVYLAAGTYTDVEGTVEVHFDNLHVRIPESERPEELDR